MAASEAFNDAVRQVAAFCEHQISDEARSQLTLDYALRGNSTTIIERRASWNDPSGANWTSLKVAQLRYDEQTPTWALYACDRNERWFAYNDVPPAGDVGPLLAEIAKDPTGIFWG
jgi:hypothetical protein